MVEAGQKPGFQDVPLATLDGKDKQEPEAAEAGGQELSETSKDGCCVWLWGHGARRKARPRSKAFSDAYRRAVQRARTTGQKAKAWEAVQEERLLASKWYNKVFNFCTCYDPEIEAAQLARQPDPREWALGLCDCVRYRDVQGRGNWMLLWSLLWPNWAYGMLWTEYVEEPQVCDNVCWDVCVTMGWRGIICCLLLSPLQWGVMCSVFLPCFVGTSYGLRKATVNKYNIREDHADTCLYGALCCFCSMTQAYIHISEIHEREDLQRLQRELDTETPQTLTDAPAALEMERPAGPRAGDVELTEAGGMDAKPAADAADAGQPKAKLTERVRKQAGRELGRVFRHRENLLVGDELEVEEFKDRDHSWRYQHTPWATKTGCLC